jgi:hypothetical protein
MSEEHATAQFIIAVKFAICHGKAIQHGNVKGVAFGDAVEADQQDVVVACGSDSSFLVHGCLLG